MGRFRSVPAVTSHHGSLDECLASGEGMVALLDRFHAIGPTMVTLHIGSGLGRVEYHLRRRVQKCYGVDISSSMIKRARQLVASPDVEFVHSDGDDLSAWPDGFFDLIYSFFVFQHLARPRFQHYLLDAHAKLGDRGRLVFQMLIDESGARPDPPASHPYGLRYYRRRDVKEALELAGFGDMTSIGPEDGSEDVVFCATRVSRSQPWP